jgi:shikimate dehydrogenase
VPRLAVIGYPVGHSLSPTMQNAALEALGLANEWSYGAIEVAPEGFEAKVREMAAGDYAGANVTVPHKAAAMAVADLVDEEVKHIGAANTLRFVDGEIRADNTDINGFNQALPDQLQWGRDLKGLPVIVLGAGGAARAVIWGLWAEETDLHVWNRTGSRAEAVCVEIGGTPVTEPVQRAYDLIVNTTSVGLRGEDPFEHLPLAPDDFDPRQTVVDMVYGERPSPLLAAAEAAGATTVDGREILVQQGARSLEIWTGREAPIETMRAAIGL